MARGGKRDGAGRKSKADEQDLIERLTPLKDSAYNALRNALKEEQGWAIKLFFEYLYGKPKQTIEQSNTHTLNNFNIKEVLGFDKTE